MGFNMSGPLGVLPDGWQLVRLAEITTKIGSGATPRGGEAVYLEERENFAFVRSQNVFDYYFDISEMRYISDDHAAQLRGVHLEKHDILLNITGDGVTFGRSCIVPEEVLPAAVNQHVSIVRLKKGVCLPGYLLAYLCHPKIKEYIASFNAGGSRRAITKGNIESFLIPLAPIETQEVVQEIVFSLNKKIELNRQINQTLEQIAQTIFKSWFVDFEPVNAKIEAKAAGRDPERAAMCAISGKLEPELDQLSPEQYQQLAATAALFPDEPVESELGLMPEGWEVKSLPEAIEVNPSRTLKKGTIAQYLDMANVPTNSARVSDVIEREFSSGSKFMNGDTLLARITPCLENGKTAFVDFLAGKQVGWGSTEFIVLCPKTPLPKAFGYLLCRHPEFRAFAIANMSGTSGRQRVPNDCFANYKLAVPSNGVASSFGETVAGIMDGIKARDEEARTLATLRDTLLPKLLSGELTVERFPEEATA